MGKSSLEAVEQESELNESTNKKKKSKKDKHQETLTVNPPMFSSPTVTENELDQPRNVMVNNLLNTDLFNDIPKKKKKSKKEKRDKEGADEQLIPGPSPKKSKTADISLMTKRMSRGEEDDNG